MLVRLAALSTLWTLAASAASTLAVWPVDSLAKVFGDDPAAEQKVAGEALIARNGHASLQFAVRSSTPVDALEVSLSLTGEISGRVRRVGYVPVRLDPPKSQASDLARRAPGKFPDPLIEAQPYSLPAGQTTAYWVTLYAPASAKPGIHEGAVLFRSGGKKLATAAFTVRVVAAAVPATQALKVTNWFNMSEKHLGRYYDFKPGSDSHWELLDNIGRVMADHKQNVMITPIFQLTDAKLEHAKVVYDFSRLDRWIETFSRNGAGRIIEGGHLLNRENGYDSPLTVPAFVVEGGAVIRSSLKPGDPRAEAHVRQFLTALYGHLRSKGWLDRYLQHVLDEAHGSEPPVYLRYVELVRAAMPGVKTMDAIDQTAGLLGEACDIWVPQLGKFDDNIDAIRDHVKAGKEAWFYTCLYPQGPYLNRFVQQPLLKTRLLHWLNFRYDFTGFLHWGGNYWTEDPFSDVEGIIPAGDGKLEGLPAGDAFIVYPWREKNTILSSIRLEAMREGIEDYELLRALAAKNPAKAGELASKAVYTLSSAVQNIDEFRAVQKELLLATAE